MEMWRYLSPSKSWRREWQPTPIFLPRKPHGQKSLEGYGPRGCIESDTTEWLTFTFVKSLLVPWQRCYSKLIIRGINTLISPFFRLLIPSWYLCYAKSLSRVWVFVTPWSIARQAPLSMGMHKVGHDWSDLAAVAALSLQADSLPSEY